jgi:allophanate hydrolase
MNKLHYTQSLDLKTLRAAYLAGDTTPSDIIHEIYDRIEQYNDPAVWIHLVPKSETLHRIQKLNPADIEQLPLYGIPFALKDNIDWAGIPTTAGCPEFSYTPDRSATVIEKLCAAGAIPIGKTNLDQFATGLVGTRSPYGICRNPFDDRYIPGGSSAGSSAAVAVGLVSFALGTDTAGSGRVPAGFMNLVGLKPTRGYLSTLGVVPAVKSLDCISIFALTCQDAATIVQVAAGFDPNDGFSRSVPQQSLPSFENLRVGIPDATALNFFGNADAEKNYWNAIDQLRRLNCQIVTIDFQPFADTAPLLYDRSWVAERTVAVGEFLEQQGDRSGINPVVKQIILKGKQFSATDAYQDLYDLMNLKRRSEQQWQSMDVLALPTTGTIYQIDEVNADPFTLNRNLGAYTNFVNLLDLTAIAIPNGFQSNGLPTGLTLMAPAGTDTALCEMGDRLQRNTVNSHPYTLGATGIPYDSKYLSH